MSTETLVRAARNEELSISEYCPSRPYLEVQVPQDIRKVTAITITLTSRDQGFCTDENLVGKEGYTWFELNVETTSGRNNVPRYCIHRNRAGVPGWQNTLCSMSSDVSESTAAKFLAEIRGGDTIQLIPRAQFPGWMNYIRSAELEVKGSKNSSTERAPELYLTYQNLIQDTDSIRFPELLPGLQAAAVVFRLMSVDLRSPTHAPYEALSYCWGSWGTDGLPRVEQVEEDGSIHLVHVSPSLRDALLHLRKPTTSRILWVDQLCINQRDMAEVGQQVGMMDKIYSRAERVIIWLGAGDPDVEQSIDTVNTVLPNFVEPSEELLDQNILKGVLPNISEQDLPLRAVNKLVSLPWFWRVWVVQERWLARATVFVYGQRTIDPDTIRKANIWSKYGGFEKPGEQHVTLPRIWVDFNTALLRPKQGSDMDILSMVLRGLDMKATNPKDYIYGLHGVVHSGHAADQEAVRRLIYPDYGKSESEVFRDFTLWWIICHESLDILSAIHAIQGRAWQSLHCTATSKVVSHHEAPPHHPTWALWHNARPKWASETLGMSKRYHVTGQTKVDASLITLVGEQRKYLKLQGYRLGSIQKIEPFCLCDHTSPEVLDVYNRLFDASGKRKIYNTPADGADPYELLIQSCSMPQDLRDAFRHWAAHCVDGNFQSALPCMDDCVFYMDDNGEGFCPAGTKLGDIVVVLYGGPVPYLLRELDKEGEYLFVGECYVADRMTQNMLTPFEQEGKAPETFVLI